MDKIIIYISAIFFVTLTFYSCNFSDSTEYLGGDYFYRNEGEALKDILCKKANGGEVPATVLDYAYDSKFIIAKQKPKSPQDPLYNKEHKYRNGLDTVYFWVILKERNIELGPLNKTEYINTRMKYKISDNLQLK